MARRKVWKSDWRYFPPDDGTFFENKVSKHYKKICVILKLEGIALEGLEFEYLSKKLELWWD